LANAMAMVYYTHKTILVFFRAKVSFAPMPMTMTYNVAALTRCCR